MPLSVETPEAGRITVRSQIGPIFTCHFGENIVKPYLHPIYSPSGAVITADAPSDHPEHHGLFFGWEALNGVDFWHEGEGRIATEPGEPELIQEENGLRIRFQHRWEDAAGNVLLHERRSFLVLPPEEKGWQLFEWLSELHATEMEARFTSRQRAMGLCYRGPDTLAGGTFLNGRNLEGPATDGSTAEFCAYSGPERSGPNAFGIALMSGRRNPHPRPEFHTQPEPFPFMSTSFGYRTPFVIPAGRTTNLRYRIALHDEPFDFVSLQMHYTAFLWG